MSDPDFITRQLRVFTEGPTSIAVRLADWQDFDLAAYELGDLLDLLPPREQSEDKPAHFRRIKHVFWTHNPLGNALDLFLCALVAAGVLEMDEDERRYRWKR